ncbi:MAG: hypothetical protein RLZZ175_2561 [Bacteroidota bacterium]|jgi:uncharacterized membrane protein SirB2
MINSILLSAAMNTGIKHGHVTIVILFLLFLGYKAYMLLTNDIEKLTAFRNKTKVLDMALGGLIILTGSYLMFIQPVIESWLYIKFAVVIAAIPLAIVGFKKSNKVLVTISLLAFIGLYGFAEMHSKLKPKVETAEGTEAVVQGKAIYAQECVKCHGDNGKLGVMNAADLTATKLTTDEISQVIKNGKGVMPGFTQYSDAEVKAISEYVLTLK